MMRPAGSRPAGIVDSDDTFFAHFDGGEGTLLYLYGHFTLLYLYGHLTLLYLYGIVDSDDIRSS